jgi:hypothetical protein
MTPQAKPLWLMLHAGCQAIGLAFVLVGVLLPRATHSVSGHCSSHCGVGATVVALACVQFLVAVVRPSAKLPITVIRWVSDIVSVWFCRLHTKS